MKNFHNIYIFYLFWRSEDNHFSYFSFIQLPSEFFWSSLTCKINLCSFVWFDRSYCQNRRKMILNFILFENIFFLLQKNDSKKLIALFGIILVILQFLFLLPCFIYFNTVFFDDFLKNKYLTCNRGCIRWPRTFIFQSLSYHKQIDRDT